MQLGPLWVPGELLKRVQEKIKRISDISVISEMDKPGHHKLKTLIN
jgi:hypothetical protein